MARSKKNRRNNRPDRTPSSATRWPLRPWMIGVPLGLLIVASVAVLNLSPREDGPIGRPSRDIASPVANGSGGVDSRISDLSDIVPGTPEDDAGDREGTLASSASILTPRIRDRLAQQQEGLNPRNDGWESEAFVEDTKSRLERILRQLTREQVVDPNRFASGVSTDFACARLRPRDLVQVFRDESVVVRRANPNSLAKSAASFRGSAGLAQSLRELGEPFRDGSDSRAEVKVVGLVAQSDVAATKVMVELDGQASGQTTQIHATWDCLWKRESSGPPRLAAIRVRDYEETTSQGESDKWFVDCTESALGDNPSFHDQIVYGLDYWLKRIERADRIHVFAATGLAVGDVNGDGMDDLYVCQPGGLPNRLFVQNQDGTATDRSVLAGVDWLDSTSSALLVDLDNDADQDLVVATLSGLLVMANDSTGRFELQTTLPTDGADMQSLSAADYDNDGDLDLYICLSFSKVTAESLRTADTFVYHDANDGAPNYLFRNDIDPEGNWRFVDVTRAVGLDVDNRRHSLAAAWEDYDNDGDQDLYVANDYGQNNLYRNDKGQFVNIARQAGVVDFGSGMSVSWGDYNRDGRMDLYVGNMFSSAGSRITPQSGFRPGVDEATRSILRRFAKGNSLFENTDGAKFREVGGAMNVEVARWAWSSLFVDVNNSGWDDLVVANGYITTEDTGDL